MCSGSATGMKKVFALILFQEEGFFLEAGVLDGETNSNTLQLEKKHGWKGILMEADFTTLKGLIEKHRKAWVVPNCVSTRAHTIVATFMDRGRLGKVLEEAADPGLGQQHQWNRGSDIICLPLYSVLQAFNQSSLDYLSLDVEGSELEVLKTIPFDLIDIKVIIYLNTYLKLLLIYLIYFRRCL